MIKTKQLGSDGISFSYIIGEIKEVIQEINKHNLNGIVSELCDVWTCTLCWITEITNINLPVIWQKSAKSTIIRLQYWDIIFKLNNLQFDPKCLCNGANWKKPDKQILAINLAKQSQHK